MLRGLTKDTLLTLITSVIIGGIRIINLLFYSIVFTASLLIQLYFKITYNHNQLFKNKTRGNNERAISLL